MRANFIRWIWWRNNVPFSSVQLIRGIKLVNGVNGKPVCIGVHERNGLSSINFRLPSLLRRKHARISYMHRCQTNHSEIINFLMRIDRWNEMRFETFDNIPSTWHAIVHSISEIVLCTQWRWIFFFFFLFLSRSFYSPLPFVLSFLFFPRVCVTSTCVHRNGIVFFFFKKYIRTKGIAKERNPHERTDTLITRINRV